MPLYPELRPLYKISKLLLILKHASRSKKSSLIRLHLFNWVLKDRDRMKALETGISNNKLSFKVWGVDPAVNYALQYAQAEGLVNKEGQSFKLTSKGEGLLKTSNVESLFDKEMRLFEKIGVKLTEKLVSGITKEWVYDKTK